MGSPVAISTTGRCSATCSSLRHTRSCLGQLMSKKPSSDIVVVDTETSGLNPFRHNLMAVAFVPLEMRPVGVIYVKPGRTLWTWQARRNFLKYETEWKAEGRKPADACAAVEHYLAGVFQAKAAVPAGHNLSFDLAFLRKLAHQGGRDELAGLSHRGLDTHSVLYWLVLQGRLPRRALTSSGAFRHFGIEPPSAVRHTALADAKATRELLLRLLDLL